MRISNLLIAAALATVSTGAGAQSIYTLQTSGVISSIFNPNNYASDGRMAVGDTFSATFTFDKSAVISYITTTGSETTAVYQLPVTYSYTFGGYTDRGSIMGDVQVDHNVPDGNGNEDIIAFSGTSAPTTNSTFTLPTSTVNPIFDFISSDPTAMTVSGTGLDQAYKFTTMPTQFSYLQFDDANNTIGEAVSTTGQVTSSSFYAGGPAAPEPATWAMMAFGIGIIAAGTLCRNKQSDGPLLA